MTNIGQILVIILTIVFIALILFLTKKKASFAIKTLIALIAGLLVGVIFQQEALIIEPLGQIYISLIKMLVMPLVIVSLIYSITNLHDTKKLRNIVIKTIVLLLITTGIASLIGILIANVMNVGSGIDFIAGESFTTSEIPTFSKVLVDMFPSNPFASMAGGQIIPVVIFSLFIAVAIVIEDSKNPEKVRSIRELMKSLNNVFVRMTQMVLTFTPYGVFSLIATIAARNGLSILMPLAGVIIALWVAFILQMVIVHSALIALIAKMNPIRFFKGMIPAQVIAFSTQSSYGTLPITIKSLVERVKIPESIASLVAPLGANIGMNGSGGIYPAIIAIFVANIFGVDLTFTHYILLVALAIITSIGIAGVPGAAMISTTVVLQTLGLPVEGIAMVMGIDIIVDMMRTVCNVMGTSTVAVLVSATEKKDVGKAVK